MERNFQTLPLDFHRTCPLCSRPGVPMFRGSSEVVLESGEFSPRKRPASFTPTYHRCHGCRVVYASPTLRPSTLNYWAGRAALGEERLERMAARTYLDHAERAGVEFSSDCRVGEVGCASGFFLEQVRARGCRVWGLEPSVAARARASIEIRPHILPRTAPDEFEGKSQVIGVFQTLEHVSDPKGLMRQIHRWLSPRGVVLIAFHDVEGWMSRILGKRSPLFDIQHYQVFSRDGVRCLLTQTGFEDIRIIPLANRYPLSYWLGLLRLGLVGAPLRALGIDPVLRLRAGNLLAVARRCFRQGEKSQRLLTPTGS